MDRGAIRYERVYFKKEQICIKDDNFLKGYSEYEIPERKNKWKYTTEVGYLE